MVATAGKRVVQFANGDGAMLSSQFYTIKVLRTPQS